MRIVQKCRLRQPSDRPQGGLSGLKLIGKLKARERRNYRLHSPIAGLRKLALGPLARSAASSSADDARAKSQSPGGRVFGTYQPDRLAFDTFAISKGWITALWRWHPTDSEQLRSIPRTQPAFGGTCRSVNGGIPLKQRKGHVMSDMTLKTDWESQGWTRPSDIAWAVGYLIVTILLVLMWTNVPA
jgi:hypothetical protein